MKRKTGMRRIAAYLLALVFMLAFLPAAGAEEAAEEPSKEETLSDEMAERFGYNAVVETDENGAPVTVNGYPFRQVLTAFNVRSVEDKYVTYTDFVDYPFWQPATKYNGNLANMSLIMTMCAGRDKQRDTETRIFDPAQDLEAYLENAGFLDIRTDDYSKETSIYTISTAMGFRRMEHEGEEPFTLIAVGVCGAGYKNEWQSNITAGKGEMHEGFRSASDLVIDRIAGYITTRGIKGRIKIWISGFSRAAAVANLTAGRLTRAGAFAKEDVYAYTFATPAAVLNPPAEGDENIFNILSPTDVVPQVMPAEWGYGRYGTDLWIPVPEFSSVGEGAVKLREMEIKNAFGTDIHYSASLNLRMRLLVSMVLDIMGSRDNYADNIQDVAVEIMQKKNASNMLTTMRNTLLSMKGSDRETRASLDMVLNYMFRVFGNAITRTELAAVNRNSGSSLFLLFTEHREDTYLANTFIIQNSLFEEDHDFTYVMVKGPADLEITVDELPGFIMTLTEKGNVLVRDDETSETQENPEMQLYYMERLGDVSIAAIPKDLNIRARWKATAAGEVEVRYAQAGLRASSVYPGASSGRMKVSAGDSGDAWMPEQKDGKLPEGFRAETWHAADIAGFLHISQPFVTWRILTILTLLVLGLAVFLVIRLTSLFFPNKKKQGAVIWLLTAVFCVAAVEAEGAYWLLADRPLIRLIWKAVAGAAVLAVFFLKRRKDESLRAGVLPGLAAAVAADLVMTYTFLAGAALFLIAHVLLVICFMRKTRMSRGQWAQWAVLSLIVSGLIIWTFVPRLGITAWAAAVYAPVLFLMVYSASAQNARIRYAAGIFLASDLLLGASSTVWTDPLAHILCMALFSASLMLFARAENRGRKRADASSDQRDGTLPAPETT